MFKRFNVAFIIFSLFVSNVFTMDNSKNKSKTIPVKLTAEQADYLFSKLTKEEQGLMYVDNGQIFIELSKESILAFELKKKRFLQTHKDRL